MTRRMATPNPVRMPVGFQARSHARIAYRDEWTNGRNSGYAVRRTRLQPTLLATALRWAFYAVCALVLLGCGYVFLVLGG